MIPRRMLRPIACGLALYASASMLNPARADVFVRNSEADIVLSDQSESGAQLLIREPRPQERLTTSRREISVRSPAPELGSLMQRVARETGLEAALLRAVVSVESDFDVKARSPRGAEGLMQLMPATARQYGVSNRFDATQNLRGGARHLQRLITRYAGNLRQALAAYNAGEGAVAQYGGEVPPYAETQAYVTRVLGAYARLQEHTVPAKPGATGS